MLLFLETTLFAQYSDCYKLPEKDTPIGGIPCSVYGGIPPNIVIDGTVNPVLSSNLGVTGWNGKVVHIFGEFRINSFFDIIGCTLKMGPGARISVQRHFPTAPVIARVSNSTILISCLDHPSLFFHGLDEAEGRLAGEESALFSGGILLHEDLAEGRVAAAGLLLELETKLELAIEEGAVDDLERLLVVGVEVEVLLDPSPQEGVRGRKAQSAMSSGFLGTRGAARP